MWWHFLFYFLQVPNLLPLNSFSYPSLAHHRCEKNTVLALYQFELQFSLMNSASLTPGCRCSQHSFSDTLTLQFCFSVLCFFHGHSQYHHNHSDINRSNGATAVFFQGVIYSDKKNDGCKQKGCPALSSCCFSSFRQGLVPF